MNDTLRDLLVADLPPTFVIKLMAAAPKVYAEAKAHCKNDPLLGDAERAYIEPHYRRALFERKMMEVALDSGLKATTERATSGAAQYNVVRVGRFLMTSSKTSSRNSVPRSCGFREQYSDVNEHIDQCLLFPVPSKPTSESLYCIVIHGTSIEDHGAFGYCCFAFPNQDGTAWAQEPIDVADIRDLQQVRYQKPIDERAEIQSAEPKLKSEYQSSDKISEESA